MPRQTLFHARGCDLVSYQQTFAIISREHHNVIDAKDLTDREFDGVPVRRYYLAFGDPVFGAIVLDKDLDDK